MGKVIFRFVVSSAVAAWSALAVIPASSAPIVIDTGVSPDIATRVDAAPTVFDNGYVIPAYRGVGQTFVAPASSFSMGFRLMDSSPGDATFRYQLYEGSGQAGRLLSDSLVTASLGDWNNPTLVSQQFSGLGVQPGQTYTLWAVNKNQLYPTRDELASGILAAKSAGNALGLDSYPSGRHVVDGWDLQAPNSDLSFRLTADATPVNYGLFIGVFDPNGRRTLNGQLGATMVKAAFDKLPNTSSFLLTGDLTYDAYGQHLNPVTNAEVADALANIRNRMGANDTLTLYVHSHGNSDLNESLIEKSFYGQGDEYLRLGENLYDNWLADQLRSFDGRRIVTFLDACHTGGFWGNSDVSDVESRGKTDLDGLTNIALYAAAPETSLTYMGASGVGIYSRALADAMLEHPDLAGTELNEWLRVRANTYDVTDNPLLNSRPRYFEMEMGDEVPFSDGMFQPLSRFTADFDAQQPILGASGAAAVSEPATAGLLAGCLGAWLLVTRRASRHARHPGAIGTATTKRQRSIAV